ncbi:MAG: GTP-binding protein [Clostridium sp.]|uniref:CobW family GTP-binding protein n=1 Tax=Clostridium sp. TaxID=1506 RepID=UPI0025B9D9D2|nr:GTP-binding protein [Clostridium sp.]MCE5220700.1 GTP-binding protein [Clostridium sp.]
MIVNSGFLGAGKTTLIKKLIQEAFEGEKLMLIENEFGEIGIDGGFLNNSGVEITEMNSGCICCSLVGDFGTALKDALTKYSPERIIIEPSGVGKLSDVIKAVENIQHEVYITLNSSATVVDATKCKMYMDNFGEFFNNQIESANTIILSRSQKLSEEKLELCVSQIREHNNKATIITTNWDEIEGKQILFAMENENSLEKELLSEEKEHHDHECSCGYNQEQYHHDDKCCDHDHEHHHHDHECSCDHDHEQHHHADEVFTSWGVETPKKYSKSEINDILKALAESSDYGVILRAKGIVPCLDGGWINFDLVPGEYEVRVGVPDYTGRLCVIGTNLNRNKIEQLFHI